MKSLVSALLSIPLLVLAIAGCQPSEPEALVVYSGRSKSLVEPIIERFQADTGLRVEVRYGDTAQLAVALAEEGARSRADVFWAQDAGALGAVDQAGLLAPLPDSLRTRVPARFRSGAGTWVATSGRARTLAYAPGRVDTTALPRSIFDLAAPAYANRVGWAPTNGSFQAHVTALRRLVGDDSTRAWLQAMQQNGAKAYGNNRAILQAIADGEVDYGLPNHYYLYGFKKDDPGFPVAQAFFAPGNPGNLINVAGAGVLQSSAKEPQALRFVHYLLSTDAQEYFADEVYEYPVIEGVTPAVRLTDRDRLATVQANIDLDALNDLDATLQMLREVGLL